MVDAASTHWTLCDSLLHGFLAMAENGRPSKESVAWTHADSLLAAAVLRGDGDAFARIINRHQAKIADQMRRFSRDPLVIEELVHEVFVEAYTSLKSFRSYAPFVHWLRKIAVRVGYRFATGTR